MTGLSYNFLRHGLNAILSQELFRPPFWHQTVLCLSLCPSSLQTLLSPSRYLFEYNR